jgi:uroporphyrin-III C-methyltransferase
MPGRDFEALAIDLIASGLAATTPCTAVSSASTPDEHIHVATLGTLSSANVGPAPVILMIGPEIDRSKIRVS